MGDCPVFWVWVTALYSGCGCLPCILGVGACPVFWVWVPAPDSARVLAPGPGQRVQSFGAAFNPSFTPLTAAGRHLHPHQGHLQPNPSILLSQKGAIPWNNPPGTEGGTGCGPGIACPHFSLLHLKALSERSIALCHIPVLGCGH